MAKMWTKNLSVKNCTVDNSLKFEILWGYFYHCEKFCFSVLKFFFRFILGKRTLELENSEDEKSLSLLVKKLYFLVPISFKSDQSQNLVFVTHCASFGGRFFQHFFNHILVPNFLTNIDRNTWFAAF